MGRIVAAFRICAGIAKPHRDHGDERLVIENSFVDFKSVEQALSAGVVPQHAAFVNFSAGRLADDHDPGGRIDLYRRSGTARQMLFTDATIADLAQ